MQNGSRKALGFAARSQGCAGLGGAEFVIGASATGILRRAGGKPIALTLKVDQVRYETLRVLGARTRRSNQEILLAALDAYLQLAQDD